MATELEAVNVILRYSGRNHVNQIEDGDQVSNLAQETLVRVRKEILNKAFKFNTLRLNIPVAPVDGRVRVLDVWLGVKLFNPNMGIRVTRGVAYVWNNVTSTFAIEPVPAEVTLDVPEFEKIPDPFAQWMIYQAASEFYWEVHQAESSFLFRETQKRRQIALNSCAPVNHNHATGYFALVGQFNRT